MANSIGVLVDRRTLAKAMRGRPTTERIALYRSIARDELGIDIVLFSVEGLSVGRGLVTGYVPSESGWRRRRVPIPRVIHKRVLFRDSAPLRRLGRLQRRGTVFVNPTLIQNKADMGRTLAADPEVSPHLPATSPYRWERLAAMLDRGTAAILKPRVGSVGQGVIRLIPKERGYTEMTTKAARLLSRSALRRHIRRATGSRRYLLQEYVNLARFEGRPFDLRVPVQRDGSGQWKLSGMVAKVARKHPFLTNAGQGGRVMPAQKALEHAFGLQAAEVSRRVGEVAVKVAKAVARKHPFAADLGLDMGVDADGKPWLIEVNTRDQRYTFHEAGMEEEFRSLYRNPLAFCARLLQELERGSRWLPPD